MKLTTFDFRSPGLYQNLALNLLMGFVQEHHISASGGDVHIALAVRTWVADAAVVTLVS